MATPPLTQYTALHRYKGWTIAEYGWYAPDLDPTIFTKTFFAYKLPSGDTTNLVLNVTKGVSFELMESEAVRGLQEIKLVIENYESPTPLSSGLMEKIHALQAAIKRLK